LVVLEDGCGDLAGWRASLLSGSGLVGCSAALCAEAIRLLLLQWFQRMDDDDDLGKTGDTPIYHADIKCIRLAHCRKKRAVCVAVVHQTMGKGDNGGRQREGQ